MELLIVGAVIGITSVFIGIFFVNLSENLKKKAVLQQILTRAVVELNDNYEALKQMLTYLRQASELVKSDDLDKKFATLLESNAFVLKSDELNQLKVAGEFMNFVDIKTNVEVNNVITRFRYVNSFIGEYRSLTEISTEEYKTIHHTYEMVESLFNTLSDILGKLKG